jgi:Flp pilus assembly protein TadD
MPDDPHVHAQGDKVGALQQFREAVRFMPENPVALCDLGLALKETGDVGGAIANLRRVLALKPDLSVQSTL